MQVKEKAESLSLQWVLILKLPLSYQDSAETDTTAGFEMGSGIYINTALPEDTARFMKQLVKELAS